MQSCEKPRRWHFLFWNRNFFTTTDYKPTLTRNDLQSLGLDPAQRPRIFSIITIPDDVTQMTANLKAPIVINVKSRIAKQIVVQENDLSIKFPVFMELQKRVVQNPKADIKSHAADWGVAVRLPASPAARPEINA